MPVHSSFACPSPSEDKRVAISAEEALALARIGEVITSFPDVGLVYDSFAREADRLIVFDQIGITRHSGDGELTPG